MAQDDSTEDQKPAGALPPDVARRVTVERARDGIVRVDTVRLWEERTGRSVGGLMLALLPLAAASSHAPVSSFRVGAVVRASLDEQSDEPFALYLGSNFEFPGAPLGASVHAEQSALLRAWNDGARSLTAVATSAPPCGHCRQFLSEAHQPDAGALVLTPSGETPLSTLLPDAFEPEALGVSARLLERTGATVSLAEAGDAEGLAAAAAGAAAESYVPYTGSPAGIALRLASGRIVTGRSCENAAFNPSVSPLQSAVALIGGPPVDDARIEEAVLAERSDAPVTHAHRDGWLLERIAPGVSLRSLPLL